MTTLPRQVEYALLALNDMNAARPGQLFAVRGLSEKHGIPFDVLSKTMRLLARARILRAVRGMRGGYQITRDLSRVSLLDVLEALTGTLGVAQCLKSGRRCDLEDTCCLLGGMTALDGRIKEVYRTTSVLELIEAG